MLYDHTFFCNAVYTLYYRKMWKCYKSKLKDFRQVTVCVIVWLYSVASPLCTAVIIWRFGSGWKYLVANTIMVTGNCLRVSGVYIYHSCRDCLCPIEKMVRVYLTASGVAVTASQELLLLLWLCLLLLSTEGFWFVPTKDAVSCFQVMCVTNVRISSECESEGFIFDCFARNVSKCVCIFVCDFYICFNAILRHFN